MREPIFIIGYPRSGTSIVYKILGTSLGWAGLGESHVMPLLQEIIYRIELKQDLKSSLISNSREILLNRIDLDRLSEINIRFIRESYLDIFNGSKQFVDKTPGADACHGWRLIKRCFPNAAIVCCYRSPTEVIESFLAKFSIDEQSHHPRNQSILSIASGWASAMEGITNLMQSEFASDAFLVNQLDLRTKPTKSIEDLFGFLGAPSESISCAIDICKNSREDIMTTAIELDSYKRLNCLELDAGTEADVRSMCIAACKAYNIEM